MCGPKSDLQKKTWTNTGNSLAVHIRPAVTLDCAHTSEVWWSQANHPLQIQLKFVLNTKSTTTLLSFPFAKSDRDMVCVCVCACVHFLRKLNSDTIPSWKTVTKPCKVQIFPPVNFWRTSLHLISVPSFLVDQYPSRERQGACNAQLTRTSTDASMV